MLRFLRFINSRLLALRFKRRLFWCVSCGAKATQHIGGVMWIDSQRGPTWGTIQWACSQCQASWRRADA